MPGLTAKQSRFVEAYKELNNGPQSAIKAGYSAKYAHIEASRLLKHDAIMLALDDWRKLKRKEVTRDDFVDLALNDYKALELTEPNKPRMLDIAGKAMGYLNNNGDSRPNQTLNITINSETELNSKNQGEIWENTRKLLGM